MCPWKLECATGEERRKKRERRANATGHKAEAPSHLRPRGRGSMRPSGAKGKNLYVWEPCRKKRRGGESVLLSWPHRRGKKLKGMGDHGRQKGKKNEVHVHTRQRGETWKKRKSLST